MSDNNSKKQPMRLLVIFPLLGLLPWGVRGGFGIWYAGVVCYGLIEKQPIVAWKLTGLNVAFGTALFGFLGIIAIVLLQSKQDMIISPKAAVLGTFLVLPIFAVLIYTVTVEVFDAFSAANGYGICSKLRSQSNGFEWNEYIFVLHSTISTPGCPAGYSAGNRMVAW